MILSHSFYMLMKLERKLIFMACAAMAAAMPHIGVLEVGQASNGRFFFILSLASLYTYCTLFELSIAVFNRVICAEGTP